MHLAGLGSILGTSYGLLDLSGSISDSECRIRSKSISGNVGYESNINFEKEEKKKSIVVGDIAESSRALPCMYICM